MLPPSHMHLHTRCSTLPPSLVVYTLYGWFYNSWLIALSLINIYMGGKFCKYQNLRLIFTNVWTVSFRFLRRLSCLYKKWELCRFENQVLQMIFDEDSIKNVFDSFILWQELRTSLPKIWKKFQWDKFLRVMG